MPAVLAAPVLAAPALPPMSRAAFAAAHLVLRLETAWGLRRSRRALAQLDDRLLRDIGLTRAQAQAEANHPL